MINNQQQTLNGHSQKHRNSCGTSVCELIVKLEGRTPPDLQQYESDAAGGSKGLDHISNKTYDGVTFLQDATPLRDLVKQELAAQRAIMVFIPNAALQPGADGVHAWAVIDYETVNNAQHAVFVSKNSEFGKGEGKWDIIMKIPESLLSQIPASDTLRYEVN